MFRGFLRCFFRMCDFCFSDATLIDELWLISLNNENTENNENRAMKYHCGVDVGSSSVRVALLDTHGAMVAVETQGIAYHQSAQNPKFVTQSSEQIVQAYRGCLERIREAMCGEELEMASIGCAATCSMVVMKRTAGGLVPYPVDFEFQNADQNVVFWMDSRAERETKEINEILEGDEVLEYHGGAFIEEMGLPKAKWLVEHIPRDDLESIVLFDLHDFMSYIAGTCDLSSGEQINQDTIDDHIAMDGSIKGWDSEFLQRIGLGILAKDNFKAIGRIESSVHSSHLPIPFAGQPIYNTDDNLTIGHGVIDCYAGWIASCGKNIQNTLTMIAGTSTCFLVAHQNTKPSPGIWGPYSALIPNLQVSEGGQSTTGKLIEHLFETHPAFNAIAQDPFTILEDRLQILEAVSGESAHFSNKEMFLYGDLSGNRTPYADGSMSGAFIGETTDKSVSNLTLKYLCILEFLAFQTRQVLESLKHHDIDKIIISGSQAQNKRFVKLLATVTNLPVEVSKTEPGFSGVKGAAYLGIAAVENKPLAQVISDLNEEGTLYEPDMANDKLIRLLDTKYKIMKDMAKTQRDYRRWVSEALR